MRRTPYVDRLMRAQSKQKRQPIEIVASQTPKQDISKMGHNIGSYFPIKTTSRPYHIQSRINRQQFQRPLTVTRAYSQLKNRSHEKQHSWAKLDRQDHRDRSLKKPRYNKDDLNQSKTHRQLLINTAKDQQFNNKSFKHSRIQENNSSKGKIYRGSSWKNQQKTKISSTSRDTSRTNNHRMMQNLTPTTKEQRVHLRKSARNSQITDLLYKNIQKKNMKNQQKKEKDDFFEYVMRFSYRTKKGYIPSNPDKVNQDAYILSPNINKKTWQHFFSVCDGHGPLGHHVSSYIKNTLPHIVTQTKNLQKKPAESLMKSFETTYQKMIKQSHVDMTFSGSTIVSCYMNHNKIYCCNVGDSRAIIGKRLEHKKWKAIPLSQDHKPSLPKQADRIKKMNGRIQAYKDQCGQSLGPLRVWLKNQNIPGLAMTRSFGDLVGASVGVSPVPQIKQFTITKQDRILLIASDGVFQFLSNQQIIDSLSQYYQKQQIQQASDHLLSLANQTWSKNSSIIDDITFILIFITYEEM